MVAQEEARLEAPEALDDPLGIGTPVDVVPQEDEAVPGIGLGEGEDLLQLGQAAMDITNCDVFFALTHPGPRARASGWP